MLSPFRALTAWLLNTAPPGCLDTPITIPIINPMDRSLPVPHLSVLPATFQGMAAFAASIPMLDNHRENELVRAWSHNRDIDAARELVLSHLRLVIKCVRDHQGYGLGREDMVQEGLVGLMKAVHRFKVDMGVRLGVFARHWIVAQIREYIFHNWRIVRLGSGKAMKKLFFGYRSTLDRLARLDPGARPCLLDERVASELGVEASHVQQAAGFLMGNDASLDAPVVDGGSAQALVPWSGDTMDVVEQEDHADNASRRLYQALEKLPGREIDIVRSRHLTQPPAPLRVLADRHGISIERVRQIEKKALESLAGRLQD